MKLELRVSGFNAHYVQIEGAMVDIEHDKNSLKITASHRKQSWTTWADSVSIRSDFPSSAEVEEITFPLKC